MQDCLTEYRQLEFIGADPIPEWFGHWFAGLVDGEGHFSIRKKSRGSFNVQLAIKLRDDDAPTLQMIQDILHVGNLYHRKHGRDRGIAEHDSSVWEVSSIRHIWRYIVPLFDRCPLRSKKKRDYDIWREAVMLKRQVNGSHLMPEWYIERMEELAERIKAVRKYQGSEE